MSVIADDYIAANAVAAGLAHDPSPGCSSHQCFGSIGSGCQPGECKDENGDCRDNQGCRCCNQADFDVVATAVAIAIAESGGRDDAHNPGCCNDDCGCDGCESSWGLWQINLCAHPQYTPDQMIDAFKNAQAMFSISNGGTNWNPWTTYTKGVYKQYLDRGYSAAQHVLNGDLGEVIDLGNDFGIFGIFGDIISSVLDGTLDAIQAIAMFVAFFANPHNWLRLGEAILGAVVLLLGTVLLIRHTEFGEKISGGVPA